MDEPLLIVLVGDIVDGFKAHGPFKSWEEVDGFLNTWGSAHAVLDLTPPPDWVSLEPLAEKEGGEE
jgi:hypothetical protein